MTGPTATGRRRLRHRLSAVSPGELLGWTAAADVMLIAIRPPVPYAR